MKVYKNRFCKCGCGRRIRVKKHHSWYGIPKYIKGHNRLGCLGRHWHPSKENLKKMSTAQSGENNPMWIDGYAHERRHCRIRNQGFIP
jgi:hypothetical protein